MSMPMGTESSEKWFIELWNYTLLPYLNDILKMKLIVNGSSDLGGSNTAMMSAPKNDPVEWLVNNYPWPRTNHSTISISQRLLRLKLYDNFVSSPPVQSSSSARSSSTDESDSAMPSNSGVIQEAGVLQNSDDPSHQNLVGFYYNFLNL
jgi:hypothetical protein